MNNTTDDYQYLKLPSDLNYLFKQYAPIATKKAFADPMADEWYILADDQLVKIANESRQRTPLFGPALRPVNWAVDKTTGDYNALLIALLGSAIGAGIGGTGGWLASKFLPKYFDEEKAPTRLGLVGAALGALPGAWIYGHNVPEHGALGALTAPFPSKPTANTKVSGLKDVVDHLAKTTNINQIKTALSAEDMGIVLPTINEPEWRMAMFRDPYLTHKEKALAAGMPFGASLAKNKTYISPMDVGRIAAGAGIGAASGRIVGTIASGFLGLTPKAKSGIQNIGLLAGALRSALNVFR